MPVPVVMDAAGDDSDDEQSVIGDDDDDVEVDGEVSDMELLDDEMI